MEKDLCFVKADMNYIDIVYDWANDETTRQNAFNTRPIPYDEHVKWYTKKIDDENTLLYICKQGDSNVGQIRVELDGNQGIISYSVDKNYRGKGIGKQLLRYAEELAKSYFCCTDSRIDLVGKVKHTNIPSQKCFISEGYRMSDCGEYLEYRKTIE